MFTEKNFKSALKIMNFVEISKDIFQKNFAENIFMQADFNQKKLFYPEQLQNRDKNTQIDSTHKENFVVFECVNRLLDKGYRKKRGIWDTTQKAGVPIFAFLIWKIKLFVLLSVKLSAMNTTKP